MGTPRKVSLILGNSHLGFTVLNILKSHFVILGWLGKVDAVLFSTLGPNLGFRAVLSVLGEPRGLGLMA